MPLESRPTSSDVVQAPSRAGQPGEVQDCPPSVEISIACHSPTAMQRPLSCGPRPMHGPLSGQRRLDAGQVLPPSVVCSAEDRKSTRLNSSHSQISYAVFCLKEK